MVLFASVNLILVISVSALQTNNLVISRIESDGVENGMFFDLKFVNKCLLKVVKELTCCIAIARLDGPCNILNIGLFLV